MRKEIDVSDDRAFDAASKPLETELQNDGPKKYPWRLVLTGLGGAALFWASWKWGRADITQWSLVPGVALAGIGLLWRIWATGWLQKNDILATQGPYSVTRNPLYLGTFFLTLGQSLMSGLVFAPILFPALLLAFYVPTMQREEEYLTERHGAAFTEYRKRVPLFVPRLRPPFHSPPQLDSVSFQWSRVHRCYKGFLGNLLVIALYAWLAWVR